MEICDKYLHELIKINPTLNDYFLFDESFTFKTCFTRYLFRKTL